AFRDDLYYRLNVVPVAVPPLRSRRDDIPLLVEHFMRRYNRQFNKRLTGVSPDALAALSDYAWPGNVRELQNVIERSVALIEGSLIQLQDLPLELMLPDQGGRSGEVPVLPLGAAMDHYERQLVKRVLDRAKGNQNEAARLLGLHRNTLLRKLARWKLSAGS
ncbi:MAG TPA: helix-turn-helix domain-containing protein, partial [Candidatus Limnocylindrales bacterium]|nr:helix-turn-helix domain-containing protein [Candidatus Limnocylindrales bacterium]